MYKNGQKNIRFHETEIEEFDFYQNKSAIPINDIVINKIAVSDKLPLGKQDFKYFIGCKGFDENRRIYFLIKKRFY